MTIKELKEKIKENPNKLHSVEKDLINNMDFLKLFNENLKVEKVIKSPFITLATVNILKDIYKKYDYNIVEEVKKFIDFARKQLPDYVFNYKVIDKRNVEIDCIHISENMLKCKTIHYTKGDGNIPLNDYSAYITWIEDGRDERCI